MDYYGYDNESTFQYSDAQQHKEDAETEDVNENSFEYNAYETHISVEDNDEEGISSADLVNASFTQIEDIFGEFLNEITFSTNEYHELCQEIEDLSHEVEIEQQKLNSKKRGTLDFVDKFKYVYFSSF